MGTVNGKARSALFARGQPGGPVVIDGANEHPGNVWWVDSGQTTTGSDAVGYGRSPDKPFVTLAYVFSGDIPTADNGDVVYLMPGHAETVDAAADILIDIAGVKIVGLGEGSDRPTITFDTDTTADIDITAANITIENVLFYCDLDSTDVPLDLSGDDFKLINCEFRDGAANKEANCWLDASSAADRLYIDRLKYNGLIAGDACAAVIQLNGGTGALIENSSFYGEVSTGCIDMVANSYDVLVRNCYFYNDSAALTKNVTDSGGSSTWAVVDCFDGKGGYSFSGGSASSVAGDDIATVSAGVSTVDSRLTATSGGVSTADSRLTKTSEGVSTVSSVLTATSGGVSTADSRLTKTSEGVSTADSKITATSGGVSTVSSVLTATSGGVSTVSSVLTATSTGVSTVSSYAAVNDAWGVRTASAAGVALDTGGAADVFTIANGPIMILDLTILVTEAVDASCTAKWQNDPDLATADTVDLCGTVDINTAGVGDLLMITGTDSDAMILETGGGTCMASPMFAQAGGLDVVLGNSNPTTGTGTAYLTYRPLASGVTVT